MSVCEPSHNQQWIFKIGDEIASSLPKILESRGWQEWSEEMGVGNWHLHWSEKRFASKELYSLHDFQKVNHFRHSQNLTRKDCLARTMKYMQANWKKFYTFTPETFIFPRQYNDFLRKDEPGPWIAKPSCGRRGMGIKIFETVADCNVLHNVVVQRYLNNPMLVGGYKFDLRIYVSVKSFSPMEIWIHRRGLCRFSTTKYDDSNFDDTFAHLTNASLNKKSSTCDDDKDVIGKGCTWTTDRLWKHLKSKGKNVRKIWNSICNIVVLTVTASVKDVDYAPQCFELFGFDIMIDDAGKCYLLEVNGSPAIAIGAAVDRSVKEPMLNDLLDLHGYQMNVMAPSFTFRRRRHSNKKKGHKRRITVTPPRVRSCPANNYFTPKPPGSQFYKSGELMEDWIYKPSSTLCGRFERIFPFDEESKKVSELPRIQHITHPKSFAKFYRGVIGSLIRKAKKKNATVVKKKGGNKRRTLKKRIVTI